MNASLSSFFQMGGYGPYVFSAYGGVFLFLAVQGMIAWQRWRMDLKKIHLLIDTPHE